MQSQLIPANELTSLSQISHYSSWWLLQQRVPQAGCTLMANVPGQPKGQNSSWIMPDQVSAVQKLFYMAWTVKWGHSLMKTFLRRLSRRKKQDGPYLNVLQKLLSVLPDCLYFSLFSLSQARWPWKNEEMPVRIVLGPTYNRKICLRYSLRVMPQQLWFLCSSIYVPCCCNHCISVLPCKWFSLQTEQHRPRYPS